MGKLFERPAKPPAAVPPLREGDRLTAKEFLRRYEADPDVTRAELICGAVFINARRTGDILADQDLSPISNEWHSTPQFDLTIPLGVYCGSTPGVRGSGPTTIRIGPETLPEPDILLRVVPECGGRSANDPKGFLVGPPELLVEVANTSVGRDMGPKYEEYERAGVAEYLIWRTTDREFYLFTLWRDEYKPVPPINGVLRSVAFPGLWLDTTALAAGDMARILATVQLGLTSPEHAAFVTKLAARAKRKRK